MGRMVVRQAKIRNHVYFTYMYIPFLKSFRILEYNVAGVGKHTHHVVGTEDVEGIHT